MKFLLLATAPSTAFAAFSTTYVRDINTESTARAFEKDPITGNFRCEPGFTGSDCSQQKCPYSMSFTTGTTKSDGTFTDWLYTPSNARADFWEVDATAAASGQKQSFKDTTFDNMHVYKECGGRGLCDRSTGECKCFASFDGEGCRRTTCPNDCSGHGVCLTDANSLYYVAATGQTPQQPYSTETPEYAKTDGTATWGNHWTYLKFQQCHCDRGFEGDDCSLRQCPQGDDPETQCDSDTGNDVQYFKCDFSPNALSAFGIDPSGDTLDNSAGTINSLASTDFTDFRQTPGGFFAMQFTDQFGGSYTTRPIFVEVDSGITGNAEALLIQERNAESIQDALEALPNFAIPSVEVDYVHDTSLTGTDEDVLSFSVTFVSGHNTGKQALLTIESEAGCACSDTDQNGKLDCTETHFSVDDTAIAAAGGSIQYITGSMPRFVSPYNTDGGDFVCEPAVRLDPAGTTADYRENAVCSNRGICDTSTGKCNCFDGYFGNSCDNVNTYI